MINRKSRAVLCFVLILVTWPSGTFQAAGKPPSVLIERIEHHLSDTSSLYYIASTNGASRFVYRTVDDVEYLGVTPDNHFIVYIAQLSDENDLVVQAFDTGLQTISRFDHLAYGAMIVPTQSRDVWRVAMCFQTDSSLDGRGDFYFTNIIDHKLDLHIQVDECVSFVERPVKMSDDANSIIFITNCYTRIFTQFDTMLSYFFISTYGDGEGGCFSFTSPRGNFLWTPDHKNIIEVTIPDTDPEISLYAPRFANLYHPRGPYLPVTSLVKPKGEPELLAWQPKHDAFLFKTSEVKPDSAENKLFLFDVKTRTTAELPFLGKQPQWSPDGNYLAGTQLSTDASGKPRFDVVVYDLATKTLTSVTSDLSGSTCNPQWSADGEWLAYDLVDAQYQDYIDCFNGRGVAAIRWRTHSDWILLSEKLPANVHLVGWIR